MAVKKVKKKPSQKHVHSMQTWKPSHSFWQVLLDSKRPLPKTEEFNCEKYNWKSILKVVRRNTITKLKNKDSSQGVDRNLYSTFWLPSESAQRQGIKQEVTLFQKLMIRSGNR